MLFRTELNIPSSQTKISHEDELIFIGSCFSQNIGTRLQKYKFKCISNPFGTIFNPVSISKLLVTSSKGSQITVDELQKSSNTYFHFDFHSCFSAADAKIVLAKINRSISSTNQSLKITKHLFITLGTSIVYEWIKNHQIVANCHKQAASEFSKSNVTVDAGVAALKEAIFQIRQVNPKIQVHFTVSPVRHIKDGIIENTKSKARLIQMIEFLESEIESIYYFPAYEFMMDDLRDYRFYESDLIHPNEMAIDYIWNKFSDHYFEDTTKEVIKKLEKLSAAMLHRPFNQHSESHQKFLKNMLEETKRLQSAYPKLNLKEELNYFSTP